MKKVFLTAFILLTFTHSAFACCGCKKSDFSSSITQKACQNIFSFISLGLSILSPRASIADLGIKGPKTNCCPKPNCCPTTSQENNQQAKTSEDEALKQSMRPEGNIIPGSNKKESLSTKPLKTKPSMFRLDLFRHFKIQIL